MKYNRLETHQPTNIDLGDLEITVSPASATNGDTAPDLPYSPYISHRPLRALARIIDPFLLLAAAGLTLLAYPGPTPLSDTPAYVITSLATAGVLVLFYEIVGLYRLNVLLAPGQQLPRLLAFWACTIAVVFSGVFLFKAGLLVSRLWLLSFAFDALPFLLCGRFIYARFLRRLNKNGQLNRRAVLVGGGEPADRVTSVISQSHESGITILGYFDDRGPERLGLSATGLKRLGSVENLIEFARSTRLDTLIITLPVPAEERLLQILNRLWILPVDIRLSAQGQKLHYRPSAYSYIGNLPCFDLYDRPLGEWGPFLKAVTDKSLAALALLLLSPVLLAVALAVKLTSKGPVLFKQHRFGFNNELVEIYKFRSMYVDHSDITAEKLVTRHDPRVTPVGRFIRRTSLDELPQLINVLRGDLSLVGPRPHATKAKAGEALYEHVVDGYFARHKVKPGITGWAQINGWRGETDTAEKIERRVEHDLYYIDNWSLTFDLYILARTPFVLLSGQNAY